MRPKPAVHLLAMPNCPTTRAYSLDGFNMATIRFARILDMLGYLTYLYASDENEAPCTELITTITKEEQDTILDGFAYQYATTLERCWSLWALANRRMIRELKTRVQPRDLICTLGGISHRSVLEAFPECLGVEYSVGYVSSFAKYRVFESRAWQHATYAWEHMRDYQQPGGDGRYYDTVIPLFFDPADFPFRAEKEPFLLYVGRFIEKKGLEIASQAAQMAGLPLKCIGHGTLETLTHGAEYVGTLDDAGRNDWMSRAHALICPTMYVEPFGAIAVEAQFAGTPVISTDFGAFTETVEQGVTGYRCSYLGEFVEAIDQVTTLDPYTIRQRAEHLYSLDAVAPQYDRYFHRLSTLWGQGWCSMDTYHPREDPLLAGGGMWDQWQARVKKGLPNFAADPLFVEQQSYTLEEVDAVCLTLSDAPADPEGQTRDEAHGARVFDTPSHGRVTRQWVDSEIEIRFLREALAARDIALSELDVLDIGAGYGRLAVALRPLVRSYTCVDVVPVATEVCQAYTDLYLPGAIATLTVPALRASITSESKRPTLAINIHSWSECRLAQVTAWLDVLSAWHVPLLFTVSHGQLPESQPLVKNKSDRQPAYVTFGAGSGGRRWGPGMSFRPALERQYDLRTEETRGLRFHPYALWEAKACPYVRHPLRVQP